MKHINPFDRMIQEQLAQEAEPAPMHLWDEIDTRMTLQDQSEKEKKRRWLLLFLFLFTTSATAWLSYENFYSNSENTLVLDTQKTIPQELNEPSLDKKALSAHENQTANSILNTVSNSLATGSINDEATSATYQESSKQKIIDRRIATSTTAKTTYLNQNQSKVKPPKEEIISQKASTNLENTTIDEAVVYKNKSVENHVVEKSQNIEIENLSEDVLIKNETIRSTSKEKNTKANHLAMLPPLDMDEIRPMTTDGIVMENSVLTTKGTKTKTKAHKNKQKQQLSSDYTALKRFFKIAPNPGSCYSFGGKNFDLRGIYVDALLSSDLPFRTLSTKDIEMLTYKEMRDHSESYYWAGTGGLRLSVVTNSGLAVRTGLVYAQITERFKHENLNAERIIIENIKDNNGNIIRTDTTYEQGRRTIEHSNHYHMVDIPLILGYEMETEKLVFNVNAGAYFNLLFTQNGRILSSSFEPIDINNKTIFRKNLGISYFASMGFNYKFTRDLHLVIEPQIRYYPKSFTRDDYAISQKYFNFGVFTGLRFRI